MKKFTVKYLFPASIVLGCGLGFFNAYLGNYSAALGQIGIALIMTVNYVALKD